MSVHLQILSRQNLKYMKRFAEEYLDREFVQQVVAQLPLKKPTDI